MNQPQPNKTTNINTQLAKERNRAAAERTLMAWIRTCLALISFGFGIDRIITAINQESSQDIHPLHQEKILGLSFITLGTSAMIAAVLEHRNQLQQIQHEGYLYKPRRSLSVIVAISMIEIGALAFLGIVIQ